MFAKGWWKRALLTWLGLWPLTLILVAIDAVTGAYGVWTYLLFYGVIFIYMLITYTWIFIDKFPWELWRDRNAD